MAEDYTPTTDNVRNVYAYIGQGFAPSERKSAADAFAAFDRWLAAHDAEVRTRALREAALTLLADETAERGTTKAARHAVYAAWLLDRADTIAQEPA